jgi:hypothetical protein
MNFGRRLSNAITVPPLSAGPDGSSERSPAAFRRSADPEAAICLANSRIVHV